MVPVTRILFSFEPRDGFSIGAVADASVVAFKRADEGLSQSVALQLSMGVVIGSRPMSRAKLRRRHHRVAHVVAGDTSRGGE